VTAVDHHFSRDANPRHENACSTCGRTKDVHLPTSRDRSIEHEFMEDVGQLVAQLRGMSYSHAAFEAYRRKVTERLAVGDERYGPTEFLNRDCLVEVEEETPDVSSYGLLEVERLQREGLDDEAFQEVRSALVTAAAYAAIADEWVHIARLARDLA
jgi:hypothetical protein